MGDQIIIDMFDETALRDAPLDGIMGNGQYNELEQAHLIKLLTETPADRAGAVLDAGCGVGRNVHVLRAAGFDNITCADFSEEMLKKCAAANPRVTPVKADLSDLSVFEDDQFEMTFVMYVFIHIVDDKELQKVIAELERVTRGPLIIGQVMDPENKAQHRICRVREFFEMHGFFKKKKLDHFYKSLYEFPDPSNVAVNRISFAIYR